MAAGMSGSRLAEALDRLDRAILSLDRAVDLTLHRSAEQASAPADHEAGDRQALETALEEAREGERRARAEAAEVGARLDQAIDRLRLVLEE